MQKENKCRDGAVFSFIPYTVRYLESFMLGEGGRALPRCSLQVQLRAGRTQSPGKWRKFRKAVGEHPEKQLTGKHRLQLQFVCLFVFN